jgi:hypothetical protein
MLSSDRFRVKTRTPLWASRLPVLPGADTVRESSPLVKLRYSPGPVCKRPVLVIHRISAKRRASRHVTQAQISSTNNFFSERIDRILHCEHGSAEVAVVIVERGADVGEPITFGAVPF